MEILTNIFIIKTICLIGGYFIGCFQSAYIFGRLFYGVDIRQHGSKNAGATNAARTFGFWPALLIFICDLLKAVVAYFAAFFIFGQNPILGLYAGVGTIIGHNWPVFLKFKGGKGAATTLALMLCIDYRLAIVSYLVGITVFAVTKYISVTVLTVFTLFPIAVWLAPIVLPNLQPAAWWSVPSSAEAIVLLALLTIMSYFRHRQNIQRLLSGNENKFSIKKKDKNNQ